MCNVIQGHETPLFLRGLFRLSIEKPEEMEVERWDGGESTTLCSPL